MSDIYYDGDGSPRFKVRMYLERELGVSPEEAKTALERFEDDGWIVVTEEDDIAHQAIVTEETFVGTDDSGETRVADVEVVPSSSDALHPETAELICDEYGIRSLHAYGVRVYGDSQC